MMLKYGPNDINMTTMMTSLDGSMELDDFLDNLAYKSKERTG